MRDVLIGQTDYTVFVRITGADGAPEIGLAHTDIDIAYARVETDNDVTTSDVTPADLASLTAAHSDWGWEEVSSTDHPGMYRLDIADAVFASGAWEAVITITDASGSDFYAHDIGFRLVSVNWQDGVRLGLTALPNAAADAAGGLPISDAGGLDLDAKIGALTYGTANRVNAQVYGMEANVVTAAAIADGAIDNATLADDTGLKPIRTGTAQAGSLSNITLDSGASPVNDYYLHAHIYIVSGTGAGQAGRIINGYVGSTKVAAVLPDWKTNPDNTSVFVIKDSGESHVRQVEANAITATSIAADAITDAKVANDVTIASVTGAVGSVTGAVGSVTAGVTVTTNNDKTGYGLSSTAIQAIWDALTSALTTVGSIGKKLADWTIGTAQTGDAYTVVSSGTHGNAALKTLIDAVQADLPQRITKNTALAGFMFTMVDSTDHVTGKTGLTITATRSLDGAAFASCTNSATEVGNGVYTIDLAAADLNGNNVTLKFAGGATADTRVIHLVTQPT